MLRFRRFLAKENASKEPKNVFRREVWLRLRQALPGEGRCGVSGDAGAVENRTRESSAGDPLAGNRLSCLADLRSEDWESQRKFS